MAADRAGDSSAGSHDGVLAAAQPGRCGVGRPNGARRDALPGSASDFVQVAERAIHHKWHQHLSQRDPLAR